MPNDPVKPSVDIILPPAVACPFLPPIPSMNRLTGAVQGVTILPCIGEQCGFFSKCGAEQAEAAIRKARAQAQVGQNPA